VDVLLAGTDAPYYNPANLFSAFEDIFIIPALDISPIEPVYTDGNSDLILVTLKSNGSVLTAFPSANYDQFTIHIIPDPSNVYVTPSVLEFSAFQTNLVKSFQLFHTQPSVFNGARSYGLQYYLKFAGTSAGVDITGWLPRHAQQVLLRRYTIIPQFDKVLGFNWGEASFNITRANFAHFALVPHMPWLDGQNGAAPYGGDFTAGGRIMFDPPVIVFEPFQTVQTFNVKAIRGNIEDSVYYRVEWEINAHEDDAENYVEYAAYEDEELGGESGDFDSHFATWHVAPASMAQLSGALLAVALAFLMLLL